MNPEFVEPLSMEQRAKLELACLAEYAFLLHDDIDEDFDKTQEEFLEELRTMTDKELIEEIELDEDRSASYVIEMYNTYIEPDLRQRFACLHE